MRFETDNDKFTVGVYLENEHRDVDLANGLGEEVLDLAVDGMIRCAMRGESPSGDMWAPNRPSTIAAKGHAFVGIASGKTGLLDPGTFQGGERQYHARAAVWTHPFAGGRREGQLDCWQNGYANGNGAVARPILGWTDQAQEQARNLIEQADRAARLQADEEQGVTVSDD